MPSLPGDRLTEMAELHLSRFADALGERLRPPWDSMRTRRSALGGGFVHPLAQPILWVPAWAVETVEARGGRVDEEVLGNAVGAAVLGYHFVRLQDDYLDEGLGEPEGVLLLSTALLATAEGLLARITGDHRFWRLFDEVMLGYAEAMAEERRLRADPEGYDEAAFERVLRRSQPLVLPGAAVLAGADLYEAVAALQEVVAHATRAVQMCNDLAHARRDLDAGNLTWVLCWLGAHLQPERLETMLARGGFDRVIDEAKAQFAEAAVKARGLPSSRAEEWARGTMAYADEWRERFFSEVFGLRVQTTAEQGYA